MADVVIAAAVRSAGGRALKGALALTRPDDLAGQVIRALMAKVPQLDPKEVDDLILGCAMPEGEQGLNMARVVGSSEASPRPPRA
jgi:acetyl-CoA acyltransferase